MGAEKAARSPKRIRRPEKTRMMRRFERENPTSRESNSAASGAFFVAPLVGRDPRLVELAKKELRAPGHHLVTGGDSLQDFGASGLLPSDPHTDFLKTLAALDEEDSFGPLIEEGGNRDTQGSPVGHLDLR